MVKLELDLSVTEVIALIENETISKEKGVALLNQFSKAEIIKSLLDNLAYDEDDNDLDDDEEDLEEDNVEEEVEEEIKKESKKKKVDEDDLDDLDELDL